MRKLPSKLVLFYRNNEYYMFNLKIYIQIHGTKVLPQKNIRPFSSITSAHSMNSRRTSPSQEQFTLPHAYHNFI